MIWLRLLIWNVQSGGFDAYESISQTPPRLPDIRAGVAEAGADTVGLIDTFRWTELYTEQDLQEMFGYKHAYRIDMNCDLVDSRIGITVLTNVDNPQFETVRLYNRDCVHLSYEENGHVRHVYVVYFNHSQELYRRLQATDLLHAIKRHGSEPVVAGGDFNALPPEAMTAPWRAAGWFCRLADDLLPSWTMPKRAREIVSALGEAALAQTVPVLRTAGLKDLNENLRAPTCTVKVGPFKLGFPLDRIMTRNWRHREIRVWPGGASDHRRLTADLVDK